MLDNLRLTRLDDRAALEAVLAVDAESFAHPWSRAMYEEDLANAHSQIWLAVAGESVVGYCAVWFVADELHINNVAVRRAWRRRGIGARLVRHVLALAADRGAARALLEVRRANTGALALYQGLGFTLVGTRRGYYSDPVDDALVMIAPIQRVGGGPGA
jgi:ribosomal-protein-alanine N-acetyltransferase